MTRAFGGLLLATGVFILTGVLTATREWFYVAVIAAWVNVAIALVALAAYGVAQLTEKDDLS